MVLVRNLQGVRFKTLNGQRPALEAEQLLSKRQGRDKMAERGHLYISCAFGLHRWSRWGSIYEGGLTQKQHRHCFRCGAVGQRSAGVPVDDLATLITEQCEVRRGELINGN